MSAPQTLFDIAGIQARIHILPGRPPFMTATDLAEVYRTEPRWLNLAVTRNPRRFPERYCFRLNEAETALLKLQNVTSTKANRALPTAFTQAGAYALSGVLTSDVAIEVGIAIYDAFAAMEAGARAEADAMLGKLRCDILVKRPIYVRIKDAHDRGIGFEALWRNSSYSRSTLNGAVRELVRMAIIPGPLAGTPPVQGDLFHA